MIRVINLDANSNCFINSMMNERSAIIVNETLIGSLSSSPNVSSWRKNTTILEIQRIIYVTMEKMFMGAVIFSKKFFGKI